MSASGIGAMPRAKFPRQMQQIIGEVQELRIALSVALDRRDQVLALLQDGVLELLVRHGGDYSATRADADQNL